MKKVKNKGGFCIFAIEIYRYKLSIIVTTTDQEVKK